MDFIYKIYSVHLYDNQLDHEWLILHPKNDVGYSFSQALNVIYRLPNENKSENSIDLIKKSLLNYPDVKLLKNEGFS